MCSAANVRAALRAAQRCPAQGPGSWRGRYYKYRLRVYNPWSRQVETLESTDPYARSLAADGARTQASPACTPALQHEG